MCGFENILKRGLCVGNLCNDSCLNVYKGVCLLKNVSMFESLFLGNVLKNCVCLFENSKDVCKFDQVTRSCLPYSKIFPTHF